MSIITSIILLSLIKKRIENKDNFLIRNNDRKLVYIYFKMGWTTCWKMVELISTGTIHFLQNTFFLSTKKQWMYVVISSKGHILVPIYFLHLHNDEWEGISYTVTYLNPEDLFHILESNCRNLMSLHWPEKKCSPQQ